VTPEEVKQYRLGSVLSGGNSAPGDLPYTDAQNWLNAADAYYEASVDPEGVEIAIPVIWGIDAVHGHANLTGAIIFPHNVGLGAANDPDLVKRIAEVTAIELSVSGHDWTFAPTLAVPQNDRWGRGYEGFSEDPSIVKSYGGAIVRGLQGELGSDEFMGEGRVMSTAKHFLGDGGTINGIDQGNADISEAELRDIHLAGYLTAIEDGTQSVMASFSSWQGQPMHGQKELLTDVLKGQMNFQGFVIGDWNGHALIPGCTSTDCPQSINAGLDMYMTPDTWKGMYESTMKHVKTGTIPMERLDDAVRRILRVKINSGVFEKPKPSARPLSGKTEYLGSKEHRDLAREAVRKSIVLLKNNNSTLPISAGSKVHIVGRGADHIGKFSGGWTLSWQGGEYDNSEFPNGETFLAAAKREVEAAGGILTYDPIGETVPSDVDVVIAVYGEDPYAEFLGDRENIDFTPNDFNTENLGEFKEVGLPVVSVFLSGRPLWTNPEINDSDAFIAAWLPGSEPAGITDLIFRTNPNHDFTGRLSFSWPKNAMQFKLNKHHAIYDPLFELGYGLSYTDGENLDPLPEESGIPEGMVAAKGIFFEKGTTVEPWRFAVNESNVDAPYNEGGIKIGGYDKAAQEDSFRVSFDGSDGMVSIMSGYTLDFQREANGAVELSFDVKNLTGDEDVKIGMNATRFTVPTTGEWQEVRIPLSCIDNLNYLRHAFVIDGKDGLDIAVSNVKLAEESGRGLSCPAK
ncbi:MAG: glycoside hydrolase family 3 protein, partial [Acidimicrobiales bacterium]